jgi:hydrogenase maturation protein HypF
VYQIAAIIDSVVQVCAENTRLIRRARGYAPTALPFPSGFEEYQGLLAVGAELKNTFCLFTRTNAIVSQHIGDLKTLESYQDFMHNIALYQRLYMTNIQRLACDLHPDYLSSKYADNYAQTLCKLAPLNHQDDSQYRDYVVRNNPLYPPILVMLVGCL